MNDSKTFLAFVTLLAVALCNGNKVSRASEPNEGLVVERKIYAFPSYEQAVQTTDVQKADIETLLQGVESRAAVALGLGILPSRYVPPRSD